MAAESRVSRRKALGLIGASGLAAGGGALAISSVECPTKGLSAGANELATEQGEQRASAGNPPAEEHELEMLPTLLLAPLAEGDRIGRWTLVSIGSVSNGSIMLELESSADRVNQNAETPSSADVIGSADGPELPVLGSPRFRLEVLARDPQAPRAPGESQYLSVFVRNAGQGHVWTAEEQGLAAMTVASLLSTNERPEHAAMLATLTARAEHREGPSIPI